ncbi:hypothetical protein JCGZ_08580 [Jatropha curcas]|uniref:Uncharacterized protein n=1 Tax=Jatropha curcas TaxID=180498 RepID=A0A067KVZ8_JATCU|nr:uncharacterized protein LOC105635541 [Jatropha curcas]XP_020535547.1 uncharacterized protein LOC105635541 [Jatropha curcas]XP_020535548.1 uncharacterized protein LOC105635541 [Jatropha curcas]KDP36450.1 hypothetical protein JCGZ_08580 [Jatropha curcas]
MSLSPFKQDIDELINEFVEGESTTLADMKKLWLSKKFSFIFDAIPSANLAFFMQSLFAHAIGYMVSTASLSQRLGGLYCLYCLYETQPFKPPFKVYLSLGELKKLKILVTDAKKQGIKVVSTLVSRTLEKNMFLFGFVDLNMGSVTQTVNQLTELQNARVQLAHKKLFADTHIEQFLHMDLGGELDFNTIKKMSAEYAEAKKRAIQEASKVVDVQNIQHISGDKESIGDVVENITGNWHVQREVFCEQTGLNRSLTQEQEQQHQMHEKQDECDDDNDEFRRQLELQLVEEAPQQQEEEDEEFRYHLELPQFGDQEQEHEEQDDYELFMKSKVN